MHNPIQISNLNLSFPHKSCFEDFAATICYQDRILILGPNGSGKSLLLTMLQKKYPSPHGTIIIPANVTFGYVPQTITEFATLSGGARFNQALTQALSRNPNVLLLDEPTNHLDSRNRQGLRRMLHHYPHTLIVISHDLELIRTFNTFWHIDNNKIQIFSGHYDDYLIARNHQHQAIVTQLAHLNKKQQTLHQALMREQQRAAQSRKQGQKHLQQHKWPTIVSCAKACRAAETSGNNKAALNMQKEELYSQLAKLKLPVTIQPKFALDAMSHSKQALVTINNGSAGYRHQLLHNINLCIKPQEHLAITGPNGCGKSTLIKAILNDSSIIKTGSWYTIPRHKIGYLDQHYNTLSLTQSVFTNLADLVPSWPYNKVRAHLQDFGFRKNEEVHNLVSNLSGGEKARLVLAQIAAKTPHLLILDEITNNLDLTTKNHVIEVLRNYPGTLLVISHDTAFLSAIQIQHQYQIINGVLT